MPKVNFIGLIIFIMFLSYIITLNHKKSNVKHWEELYSKVMVDPSCEKLPNDSTLTVTNKINHKITFSCYGRYKYNLPDTINILKSYNKKFKSFYYPPMQFGIKILQFDNDKIAILIQQNSKSTKFSIVHFKR